MNARYQDLVNKITKFNELTDGKYKDKFISFQQGNESSHNDSAYPSQTKNLEQPQYSFKYHSFEWAKAFLIFNATTFQNSQRHMKYVHYLTD